MAVNRNFVVKNGLEVSQDLILANDTTRRIGIGSTVPEFTLDVRGGIGASTVYVSGIATINVGVVTTLQGTNLNYSGVSTITSLRGTTAEYDTFYGDVGIITSFNTTGIGTIETKLNVGAGGTVLTAFVNAGVGSVGIGTSLPEYTLDIRGPVSTGTTALYVQGDVRITGDLNLDDVTLDQADIGYLNVTGFATVSNLFITGIGSITSQVGLVTNITGTNLNYSGIGTVVNLTGTNLNYTGVGTINTLYGTGAEFDTIYADVGIVTNVSSTNLNVTGIATIASVSIAGAALSTLTVSQSTQLSGIATINQARVDNGIVTSLNVTGVATIATANITTANLTNTSSTTLSVSQLSNLGGITTINAARIDTGIVTSLNVTGVTTLGSVVTVTPSGIITSTNPGVTTVVYYGDGTNLTGVVRGVGIASTDPATGLASVVGFGATIITFKGPGISTTSPIEVSAGIATITFEGGGGSGGYQTSIIKESYTVTSATQSVFDLADSYTPGYIDVYLNGVKLNSGDFTETDADTVTLTTAAVNGDIVEFVNYKVIAITGDFETRIVKEEFTVSAATQSVFSLSNAYTAGYIDVYLNGSKLTSSDYTETDSTTVTLTSAAVTGDVVEFINFEKRGISEVDPFWITTNSGATRIGIHTLTKVGIGTTLPTSNLHVNGDVLVTGIVTASSFVGNLTGTATNANNINISATTSSDTSTSVVLVADQSTGNQSPFIDSGLQYNANTNALTATTFSGNATGLTGTPSITVSNITSGNINSSGIVTASSAIVGSAVTINATGVNVTGIVTASSDIKIGTNSVATNGKAIAMAMVFGG